MRGLIHSDGCRGTNVVGRGKRPGGYSYPFYGSADPSADIRAIFRSACDRLGVSYRERERNIRIARRSDVEKLDLFVGPKA